MEDKPDMDPTLRNAFDQYGKEQKEWRKIIARSRIQQNAKLFDLINNMLLALIIALFVAQLTFRPLGDFFSLELGLFLISLKIFMMINASSRFNHFQFWIMHSIEQRVEAVNERLDAIEAKIGKKDD